MSDEEKQEVQAEEPKTVDNVSDMLPTDYGTDDEQPSDTEAETTEVDTEVDTEAETEDDNPDLALLREYGLDKTYSSLSAALAGAREGQVHIGEQRAANQQLRDTLSQVSANFSQQQQQPQRPQQSQEEMADEFATDPDAALRRSGYVKQSDVRSQITPLVNQLQNVQARNDRLDFAEAVGQFEDLRDVADHVRRTGAPPPRGTSAIWDEMDRIYQTSPSLTGDIADLVPLLYPTAKARLTSGPKVSPVPDEKKRGASTTSTGRGRPGSGKRPDFDTMSETEIEKWFEEQGLIN